MEAKQISRVPYCEIKFCDAVFGIYSSADGSYMVLYKESCIILPNYPTEDDLKLFLIRYTAKELLNNTYQ